MAPDENGNAQGLETLTEFLDEVLAHLGNRTTAQERVSYHVAESYVVKEEPVQYGSLVLAERDVMSDTTRALPPFEHHVVVAWYNSPEQLAWTLEKGIANVRLGDRPGSWHIPPEMASARHLLLRTHGGKVAVGLFRLTKPGYKVYSANDLTAKGYPGAAGGEIYAVFEVEPDPAYAGRKWDEAEVTNQIKETLNKAEHSPSRLCRQAGLWPAAACRREPPGRRPRGRHSRDGLCSFLPARSAL